MIRTTLTAMPRRPPSSRPSHHSHGVVAVAGTTAVLGSLLAGRLILPRHGFTATRGYPARPWPTGQRFARPPVDPYLTLIALLSLGIAAIVRDSATSIGVILGLPLPSPIISQVIGNPHWQRMLQQIAPMSAGLAIQATTISTAAPQPWAGLGVTTGWAAAALVAGGPTDTQTRRLEHPCRQAGEGPTC